MHLQHWLSAQRWTDGINMWNKAVGIFNIQIEKHKTMICGIQYFITKLKTKFDVIPQSLFKIL